MFCQTSPNQQPDKIYWIPQISSQSLPNTIDQSRTNMLNNSKHSQVLFLLLFQIKVFLTFHPLIKIMSITFIYFTEFHLQFQNHITIINYANIFFLTDNCDIKCLIKQSSSKDQLVPLQKSKIFFFPFIIFSALLFFLFRLLIQIMYFSNIPLPWSMLACDFI